MHFFAIIWIEYALVYMTKNCFNAAMASIVYENVLTKTQTGLISSAFYLTYAPLQVVGGILADRHNPETMVKWGLISSAFLNFVLFFFHDYHSMLVIWALNGVAQFGIWPAIFKIISAQLAPSQRKGAVFYISFASIGGLLLSYLIAAVVSQWEYNFLISGFVLLTLAILWLAECHNVDRFMVADASPEKKEELPQATHMPTGRLFYISGFYILVASTFLRYVVDQSIKTFSPTMLTELYQNITPAHANLLNMLIIAVTIGGAFLARKLYPKIIHSEAAGMVIMLAAALPFSAVLLLAGKIPLAVMLICMCCAAAVLNSATVLMSFLSVHFTRFGKSATAAGIINAAYSGAIVFNSYGIALIADLFGWHTVTVVWIALLACALVLVALVRPRWKRFVKENLKG